MTTNASLDAAPGGAAARNPAHLLGVALFLGAIVCAFLGFVPLTKHLSEPCRIWLVAYAAAGTGAAALLFVNRGRLLLIASLAGLFLLLLVPVVWGGAATAILKWAWVTILCAGLGRRCFRWLTPQLAFSVWEDLFLSTTAGYGLLAVVVLALGSLQLLQPVYAYLTLSVLTALLIPDLYALFRRVAAEGVAPLPAWWSSADLRLPALAGSLFAICSFGAFVWAVSPAVHWDALAYHLAVPEIFIHRGGLAPTPENVLYCFVRNADMLFLLGLLIEGQPLPALFHFLFSVLTAGLLCCLGTRIANLRVGVFAACLFYALPLVTWQSGTAYTELFVAGFTLAAAYGAVLWWKEDEPAWLTLASLMGGLAIGTKLNALLFAAPIALLVVARLVIRHPRQRLFGCLLRLTLPGLLVSGPWFVQAWAWTGNPVFPMLNAIFHSPLYPSGSNEWFNWHRFGCGTTWPYFLRLPWDLNFRSERFGDASVAAFAGMSLLGLPWTVFQASRSQRRLIAAACLFLAASLGLVFCVAQYFRYLFPVFTVFALIAAVNVEHTWKLISRYRWRRAAMVLGLVTAMAWLTLTRFANVAVNFYTESRYPWKLFVGKETPRQFLQRDLREYEALRFIAERLEGDPPRLLGIGNGQRFYSEDAVIYDWSYSDTVKRLVKLRDHRQILDALRENRIDYLLVDQPRYEELCGSPQNSWGVASQPFLHDFSRLVFARNRIRIYQIFPKDSVERLPPARRLVENSSFDRLNEEGKPLGWVVVGKPTIDTSGRAARSAPTALRASFQDYAWQRVKVRQGAVYTISAFVRADKPGQKAILEFVWLDKNEQIVCSDIVRATVGQTWEHQEDVASCRDGAVQCQVAARGEPGCEVWFDDVQLSETVVGEYVARK